jgi:hypothetical protein
MQLHKLSAHPNITDDIEISIWRADAHQTAQKRAPGIYHAPHLPAKKLYTYGYTPLVVRECDGGSAGERICLLTPWCVRQRYRNCVSHQVSCESRDEHDTRSPAAGPL